MGAKADKIIELKNTVAAYEGQIDAFKVALQGKQQEIVARNNIIENLKNDMKKANTEIVTRSDIINDLKLDLYNKKQQLGRIRAIDSESPEAVEIALLRRENKKLNEVVEKFKQLGQITLELKQLIEGI